MRISGLSYAARIVLLLLGVSLAAGAITGQPLYFRLVYLWLILLGISAGMAWFSLRGVQLRRNARFFRSQVGQVFEERYEIQNTSRWPRLWIEVRDQATLPGSHGSHVLTLIGGRESRTYLSRIRLVQRGVYALGPTVLVSGDLFGLFPVSRTFPSSDSILVYPMMVPVFNFPNPPGLLPGGEALRRRTPQITSNASGVREYAAGDPLNRIHWVSTARRDRLIVKEFELDPRAEVWIILDAAQGAQASKPYAYPEFDPRDFWRKKEKFDLPPSTFEYGVTAAASLARFFIQKGRSVGIAATDQSLRLLPADRGGRQLGKILQLLALLQGSGNVPLQGLIETQARHLPRGSTVVFITPSAAEAIIRVSDLLLRRGLRPVAVLLDSASFGGYFSSGTMAASLRSMRIPCAQIEEGGDLTAVLSSMVAHPGVG